MKKLFATIWCMLMIIFFVSPVSADELYETDFNSSAQHYICTGSVSNNVYGGRVTISVTLVDNADFRYDVNVNISSGNIFYKGYLVRIHTNYFQYYGTSVSSTGSVLEISPLFYASNCRYADVLPWSIVIDQ